jgi:hypothetical protein
MEDRKESSCWGVAAKAAIGFAGVILLAWLFGGGIETGAMLAAG